MACDGRNDTRWSSQWTDAEWLQIDLSRPAAVCGATIAWEDAFAAKYRILVSQDGTNWSTAYTAAEADGHTDEIFFAPVTARYVRVACEKRGTSWGCSIWEMDVKGPAERLIVEAPEGGGDGPDSMCDGRLDTQWISPTSGPAVATLDLRKTKPVAGIRIDWGKSYATRVRTSTSTDGTNWTAAGGIDDGTGQFDYILFPKTGARFVRLELQAPTGSAPPAIREISFLDERERLTETGAYEIAARKAPPGHYPQWLVKRQTYWTIVGLPADTRESLFDEYGNLEPWRGSWSLTPYLYRDGKLQSAFDAASVTQSLSERYLPLPTVRWEWPDLRVTIDACTDGSLSDSVTWVRYQVSNVADRVQTGRLFLAVRPLQINPPWHQGGLSRIRTLSAATNAQGSVALVDGTPGVQLLSRPDGFGACPFNQGDVARSLALNELPLQTSAHDDAGLASGAFAFDWRLPPNGSTAIVVAVPLHGTTAGGAENASANPDRTFERVRGRQEKFWHGKLNGIKLDLPDKDVVDTFKSQLAYILINADGPAIQPGPRNYKRSWIRDGSMTMAALLKSGYVEEPRSFIDWYSNFVETNGLVHHIMNTDGTVSALFTGEHEWDSQGEYVYAVMEFYRFTQDRKFLEREFDHVIAALRFLATLRQETLAGDYMSGVSGRERFVGILPKSISHEGYIPAVHSYWDDFWALAGWREGAAAASILGREDIRAWAQQQYDALRTSLASAIRAAIAFHHIDFVPGSAEKGDFDPTSTSIAFFCGEEDLLPEPELSNTFARFCRQLDDRMKPGWSGQFVPYEIRSVSALAALGRRDDAYRLLRYLLDCREPRSWNQWVELYVSDRRLGTYIGDMPHTWVGSSYLHVIRDMIVRESGRRLIILGGAPPKWVLEGDGIHAERLPTYFGDVNLQARVVGGELRLRIAGAKRELDGYDLYWPYAVKPREVTVDGKSWRDFDSRACRLPPGDHTLVARLSL